MMKQFLLFSVMSLFCLTISAQNWVQLGNDMDGTTNSHFGADTSLSSDGNTLAVGAPYNSDNGNKAGQIKVFAYNGTSWVQKGSVINGEAAGDNASLVALSADGVTVAVASTGNYSLKARIFDFDGSDWMLRGSAITGIGGDLAGGDMSLSDDGNRIILAFPGYSSSTGVIRIYEWNGTSWNQLGSDINGDGYGSRFGQHAKFNADGSSFITGTVYYPSSSALNGQVQIYAYNGSEWIQKGSDIVGDQQYAVLGSSVDISDDGNTIIVGEPGFTNSGSRVGRTRVFVWNGTEWEQKGSGIEGISDLDKTGFAVALNSAGNIMATKGLGGGGSEQGNVRMYQFNNTDWVQLGQTIVGGNGDTIGSSLDFSATGNTISIGNPGRAYNTGQMKVYQYDGPLAIAENTFAKISVYPNPSHGTFKIDLGREYTDVTVRITDILGKLVSTSKYASAKMIEQDITAAGVYFVRINSETNSIVRKLVVSK